MFDAIPHKNKPKAKQKTINAVDLFCGAGGTSTGLIDAVNSLGYSIKLTAINHWDVAIATHSKNHEEVEHYCQSIESVNPTDVIKGGRLQLLVASPECTHHSNARGGKPRSDQKRADAWLLLRWIEKLYVENILIENVKEFESWGPLNAKGLPDKRHKGILFRQFIDTLRSFNYNVEWKVLNCADYGDPTTRERLFVIARRPKHKPIVWPERTHASRKELVKMAAQPDLFGESARQLKPWVAAREIIDWSLEGKSIFGRKKPLSPNTMRRIFKGLEKHGLKNFLVNLKNADRRDRSVDEPTFTQATANHQAVVEPFIVPQNSAPPTRDIDEPVPTLTTTSRGVGVVEVEPFTLSVERAQTNRSGPRPVEEPVATITGSPRIGIVEGEIQPFTISAGGPELPAQSTDEPLRTILTRDHQAIIEAFLIKFHGGENAENRNHPIDEPIGTLDTSNRFGLVEAEPFIVPFFGERDGQEPRTRDINEPAPTVTTHGRMAVVEADAFLLGQQSGAVARDIDEPVPTVAGKGAIGKVDIDPFLVRMKNNQHSGSVDDPLQTLTTKESYAIAEPYIIKFFGNGENVDSIDDPLSTVTAKDRFALCIPSIGIALDIRFRMLQPHELAAAMSFPKDYEFTGNREAKVKQIGNAVPLKTSKALCRALLS